jgi:hypothetical protein
MLYNFHNVDLELKVETESLLKIQEYFRQKSPEIEKAFAKFNISTNAYIDGVTSRLSTSFDSDIDSLQEQLVTCMSLIFTGSQLLTDARVFHQIYEMLFYCPKQKEYSDPDRKLYTQTKTIFQSRLVYMLGQIVDKLEKRIITCQSLLKVQVATMNDATGMRGNLPEYDGESG